MNAVSAQGRMNEENAALGYGVTKCFDTVQNPLDKLDY